EAPHGSCNPTSARRRSARAGRSPGEGRRSCRSRDSPRPRDRGVCRDRSSESWSNLDAGGAQGFLELGNGNGARMEYAGRERSVDASLPKDVGKMLHRPRAAGGDQRHVADLPHGPQLLDVIAAPHAVASHAIEDDLARAALLNLAYPGEDVAAGLAGAVRIAGELIRAIAITRELAVDADDDALGAEAVAERADELGIGEGGGVDGHLLRARVEDFLGVGHGADAARHAERNIQHPCYPPHPAAVDRAALGTRRDVVKDELVRALIAVAGGELHDVAHDPVVAEADALYDLAVADVEAGNDASSKNGCSSSGLMRSSSSALPLTAAATPVRARAARSAASRTPPDACQAMRGWRPTASR